MKIVKIDDCIDCPFHKEKSDDQGFDGYTKIYCSKLCKEIGETKTRWLYNGYSSMDPHTNCPLKDEKDDDY